MLVIAGLGNPGASHADNRHNIGFMAVEKIALRHGFTPWRSRFKSLVAEGELGGERILAIKPQTFMNLSGEAVGAALRFYKLAAQDLIVIYDELDLTAGKLRIKTGGGAGGHNGVRSIDAHCGKDYRRVRLGIGHPGNKAQVQRHVLSDFAKADAQWLEPFLEAIAENAGLLAKGEDSTFMNRVTLATADEAKMLASAKKGQSHIRQARNNGPPAAVPTTGPMAAMLKKLFGRK